MQLLHHQRTQDDKGVDAMANRLVSTYPKTVYASQAALIQARNAADKKDYEQAIEHLNWVEKESNNQEIKEIAYLRKARLQINKKNYEQAMQTLGKVNDKTFQPLVSAIKGDVFRQQNKNAEAKEAYRDALKSLPEDGLLYLMTQMKLADLPALEKQSGEGA